MTDEDALLQAVIADPDDDAPRLIYADWLDEQGQSERAEFIRVQCQMARLSGTDPLQSRLDLRSQSLLKAHGQAWGHSLQAIARNWAFDRGFVHQVSCDTAIFLRRAPELFQLAPVQHLRLRNVRPLVSELVKCPFMGRAVSLDFRFDFMGDWAVQTLSQCLFLGRRLRRLDLTANQVRRGGALALISSLGLRELEELDLRENPQIPRGDRELLRRHFGDRVHF